VLTGHIRFRVRRSISSTRCRCQHDIQNQWEHALSAKARDVIVSPLLQSPRQTSQYSGTGNSFFSTWTGSTDNYKQKASSKIKVLARTAETICPPSRCQSTSVMFRALSVLKSVQFSRSLDAYWTNKQLHRCVVMHYEVGTGEWWRICLQISIVIIIGFNNINIVTIYILRAKERART